MGRTQKSLARSGEARAICFVESERRCGARGVYAVKTIEVRTESKGTESSGADRKISVGNGMWRRVKIFTFRSFTRSHFSLTLTDENQLKDICGLTTFFSRSATSQLPL